MFINLDNCSNAAQFAHILSVPFEHVKKILSYRELLHKVDTLAKGSTL